MRPQRFSWAQAPSQSAAFEIDFSLENIQCLWCSLDDNMTQKLHSPEQHEQLFSTGRVSSQWSPIEQVNNELPTYVTIIKKCDSVEKTEDKTNENQARGAFVQSDVGKVHVAALGKTGDCQYSVQ